ncbi:DUF3545 family protein [Catenovulum adriaticum]|uniref:DUF3545 family protein n=1 Tax=Catenovulum adriaticum TaxID=2984846 RepID=A0ABY7ARG7_9ALTE|nr:DUF3545 family protein [Catenovulum sp. TS8]WAJ71080.1 DUF3545 family protein [Catenovulum sp. TS8]
METHNDFYSTPAKKSKCQKKRKWREIEAILDQRSLEHELKEIDEFFQLDELERV